MFPKRELGALKFNSRSTQHHQPSQGQLGKQITLVAVFVEHRHPLLKSQGVTNE
jgi:hypothetical protein